MCDIIYIYICIYIYTHITMNIDGNTYKTNIRFKFCGDVANTVPEQTHLRRTPTGLVTSSHDCKCLED